MNRSRSRHAKPQLSKLLGGLVAFVLTLGVYVPHSPLRIAATAASEAVQRRIGSMGWQPVARAFLFHIPFHRQEHALSCEVASLRSALLGLGIDVPERNLFAQLKKDPTPKTGNSQQGYVWGDPDTGFVGDVDGRMPVTGYGVFAGPLKVVADVYASSSIVDVSDMRAIDGALREQHPIIAWYVLGNNPSVMRWTTLDGTEVHAPLYEHTLVIVGYRGTADDIHGVYAIDPLTSLQYIAWDDFVWRTSLFNHQGLEVGSNTGQR